MGQKKSGAGKPMFSRSQGKRRTPLILRDAIDRDGFAIIPNVLPSGEVEQILEQICASAPRRTRAGVRHALRLGPVSAVAQQPNVIQLAQVVLGPEAFPFRATLFDKSPGSN
jgi:hypothetical protein